MDDTETQMTDILKKINEVKEHKDLLNAMYSDIGAHVDFLKKKIIKIIDFIGDTKNLMLIGEKPVNIKNRLSQHIDNIEDRMHDAKQEIIFIYDIFDKLLTSLHTERKSIDTLKH